jgi:hypothetical protein
LTLVAPEVFQFSVLPLPLVTVAAPKDRFEIYGAATTWNVLEPLAEEPAAL